MSEPHPRVLVLWGSRCEEFAVGLFVAALRRCRVAVQIVGVSGRAMAGDYGVALVPDVSLCDVLPLMDSVRYVIIPCDVRSLRALRRDPRLERLLRDAHAQEATFIVRDKGIFAWNVVVYPTRESLAAFAQMLAQTIARQNLRPAPGSNS